MFVNKSGPDQESTVVGVAFDSCGNKEMHLWRQSVLGKKLSKDNL